MNGGKAPALRAQLMEPYLGILYDRNIPSGNLLTLPGLEDAESEPSHHGRNPEGI